MNSHKTPRKTEKQNPDIEEGKIEDIPTFKHVEDPKKRWTGLHYWVGNLICAGMILTFLLLVLFQGPVPEYLVGLVGSIIGYYIARAPYEL